MDEGGGGRKGKLIPKLFRTVCKLFTTKDNTEGKYILFISPCPPATTLQARTHFVFKSVCWDIIIILFDVRDIFGSPFIFTLMSRNSRTFLSSYLHSYLLPTGVLNLTQFGYKTRPVSDCWFCIFRTRVKKVPFKVTVTGKWWRRHCLNIHYAIIAITRVRLSKNMHKRNFGSWDIFKDSQNLIQGMARVPRSERSPN